MQKERVLSLPDEIVMEKIHALRGKKVMLDRDLAELYGVTTGNLNKAVLRNIARFPGDFMFQLTKKEFDNLLFQTGRSSWGGRRTPPRAFTEQGVAMLSGVLHSERAINMNIHIMRVFTHECVKCSYHTRRSLENSKIWREKISHRMKRSR